MVRLWSFLLNNRHLHRFSCCPNFIKVCFTFVEPLTPRCNSELLLTNFCIIVIQDATDCAILTDHEDWLGSPANIKLANKDAKIYVERSTTLHNLLFSPHTPCMNYVTNTFLLVSSSVRSKQLLYFVQGQGQKTEQ